MTIIRNTPATESTMTIIRNIPATYYHGCGWAKPQVRCNPSIRWDVLQAPALAKPAERYQGHLPGSGVQRHSADEAYAWHGIIMEAHESGTGRRLWLAKQGKRVLAAHPKHDAARFMALALVTGA